MLDNDSKSTKKRYVSFFFAYFIPVSIKFNSSNGYSIECADS